MVALCKMRPSQAFNWTPRTTLLALLLLLTTAALPGYAELATPPSGIKHSSSNSVLPSEALSLAAETPQPQQQLANDGATGSKGKAPYHAAAALPASLMAASSGKEHKMETALHSRQGHKHNTAADGAHSGKAAMHVLHKHGRSENAKLTQPLAAIKGTSKHAAIPTRHAAKPHLIVQPQVIATLGKPLKLAKQVKQAVRNVARHGAMPASGLSMADTQDKLQYVGTRHTEGQLNFKPAAGAANVKLQMPLLNVVSRVHTGLQLDASVTSHDKTKSSMLAPSASGSNNGMHRELLSDNSVQTAPSSQARTDIPSKLQPTTDEPEHLLQSFNSKLRSKTSGNSNNNNQAAGTISGSQPGKPLVIPLGPQIAHSSGCEKASVPSGPQPGMPTPGPSSVHSAASLSGATEPQPGASLPGLQPGYQVKVDNHNQADSKIPDTKPVMTPHAVEPQAAATIASASSAQPDIPSKGQNGLGSRVSYGKSASGLPAMKIKLFNGPEKASTATTAAVGNRRTYKEAGARPRSIYDEGGLLEGFQPLPGWADPNMFAAIAGAYPIGGGFAG